MEDANNNVVAGDSSTVTLTLSSGTFAGGSNTATAVASGGVATFSDLSIDQAGTGYTLSASDGSLSGAISGSFNITAGAANKVVFTTQPSNTAAGASITPAVQVSVEDAYNNVVTTDISSVKVALSMYPVGGTLSGALTVAAVSGVATFSNLSVNNPGMGYTLTAWDGALNGAGSGSFNVTQLASKLAFTVQPSNTAAGASITPAVQVSVEDANNNVIATDNSNVTVALSGSGTLGGTLMEAAINGVAKFSDLSINKAGTDYTLTATDGSLTGTTFRQFQHYAGDQPVGCYECQ